MQGKMDDETAIAMALMLGCKFFTIGGDWWVERGEVHPLEAVHGGWAVKAELARDYIAWYQKAHANAAV
jgi:hypothetical protein